MAHSKRTYKDWNNEDLDRALESIREGSSYGQASKAFGIPKGTLFSRIKSDGIEKHNGKKNFADTL